MRKPIDRRAAMAVAAGGLLAPAAAAAALHRGAGSAPGGTAGRGELAGPAPAPPPPVWHDGFVQAPGARLYYRDSGGTGPVVLLAHPATGSALVWDQQVGDFTRAGFRLIAWSRRGFARTEDDGPAAPNVSEDGDIDCLADALKLDRFHALGSAAGGGVMLDYAIARPDRVGALIMACSIGNIADADFRRRSAALRPDPFGQMPAEVRELGPCYRAADPAGVARWIALEARSRTTALGPPPAGDGNGWAEVAAIKPPVLWLAGDADLFAPPPLIAEFHVRVKGSEMVVIDGAGHSAYWERPAAFNAAVIDFLRRRG